ncbi:MAG: alpha/beta hydrolase, partial [Candidatus Thiodiazotropha sp.]
MKNRKYWLFIISAIGAAWGVALTLYPSEIRNSLEWLVSYFFNEKVPLFLIVIPTALVATALVSRHLNLKNITHEILPKNEKESQSKEFIIKEFRGNYTLPKDDKVLGRSLKYIEYDRHSDILVICLHGLGLSADDFNPFILSSEYHVIAVTMFGFNANEKDNRRYKDISLETHIRILLEFIIHIASENKKKDVVLVGFSFGADSMLKLAELIQDYNPVKIKLMLFLDCNINRSTMNIADKISKIDINNPVDEFQRLSGSTDDLTEYLNMLEYIRKISNKNLTHVKRHASDYINYWGELNHDYDVFIDRVSIALSVSRCVRLVFSENYENDYNSVVNIFKDRLKVRDYEVLKNVGYDHFDLIKPILLNRFL